MACIKEEQRWEAEWVQNPPPIPTHSRECCSSCLCLSLHSWTPSGRLGPSCALSYLPAVAHLPEPTSHSNQFSPGRLSPVHNTHVTGSLCKEMEGLSQQPRLFLVSTEPPGAHLAAEGSGATVAPSNCHLLAQRVGVGSRGPWAGPEHQALGASVPQSWKTVHKEP